MAKKQKLGSPQKESKVQTKVIKMVKSPRTGKYAFKEEFMSKDNVKDFLAAK